VLGKYIISDKSMSEEQWAREHATVLDTEPARDELVPGGWSLFSKAVRDVRRIAFPMASTMDHGTPRASRLYRSFRCTTFRKELWVSIASLEAADLPV
jgi:hypothetical protein